MKPLVDGFDVHEWTVLPAQGVLKRRGETLHLRPQTMDLLLALAECAGSVATKEWLHRRVWGGAIVEEGALARGISELRRALGDDAKNPVYIATVPKKGYRLLPTPASPAPARPQLTRHLRRRPALWLAAVAGFAVLIPWLYAANQQGPLRIGITPSHVTVAARDQPLCVEVAHSLDVALPAALARATRDGAEVLVIEDLGFHAHGVGLASAEMRSLDYLVTSVIETEAAEPRISVLLRRVGAGSVAWSALSPVAIASLPSFVDRSAKEMAQVVLGAGAVESVEATPHAVSREYLRGRRLASSVDLADVLQGIEDLRDTVRQHPGHVEAHVELAKAYLNLHRHPVDREAMVRQAEASASAALAIDASSKGARLVLAETALRYRFDWAKAEEILHQVLQRSPEDWQALALKATLLTATLRHDEAIETARSLHGLAPLDNESVGRLALTLYMAGRFDEAETLARSYYDQGDIREVGNLGLGLFNTQLAAGRAPAALATANAFLAARGDRAAGSVAEFLRRWRQALLDREALGYHHDAQIAWFSFALGEEELALDAALRACESRSGWFSVFLAAEPAGEGLRRLPGYAPVHRCMSTPILERPFRFMPGPEAAAVTPI